jgi:hypothetical protein
MRKRFMVGAVCAAAATLGVGMASASPTLAADNAPCKPGAKRVFNYAGYNWNETLFTCSTWRNNVPVHQAPDPNSPVIGYLKSRVNWYLFEFRGARVNVGRFYNSWWASTKADASTVVPGKDGWGYVNEVYFSGGDNDQDDAGLLQPGSISCAQATGIDTCPRILPPWRLARNSPPRTPRGAI